MNKYFSNHFSDWLRQWPRGVVWVVLFAVAWSGAAAFADLVREASVDSRLKKLEAQLTQLETLQQTMLQENDEMIQKIQTLKIWSRRNCGGS